MTSCRAENVSIGNLNWRFLTYGIRRIRLTLISIKIKRRQNQAHPKLSETKSTNMKFKPTIPGLPYTKTPPLTKGFTPGGECDYVQ